MRYLPATAIAIGVAVSVSLGLYLTKEPICLWGLLLMFFAYHAVPFKRDER